MSAMPPPDPRPDLDLPMYYQTYRLVEAAPIVAVSLDPPTATVSVGGVETVIPVEPIFFELGTPTLGDYLIAYSGPTREILWEPAAAFEQAYTPVLQGPPGPPGPTGETGPPGPTAVSADAGNRAVLGSDALTYVPNTFVGVTDGSDAQPGDVGEYITIDNIVGVALGANNAQVICTIPLPPGCWEIWGACDFAVAAAAGLGVEPLGPAIQPSQLGSAVSVTPDSLPTDEELILGTGVMNLIYSPLAPGQRQVLITGQCRSNSTGPVSLYLVAQIGTGNATVKGYISARRVR